MLVAIGWQTVLVEVVKVEHRAVGKVLCRH